MKFFKAKHIAYTCIHAFKEIKVCATVLKSGFQQTTTVHSFKKHISN